ERESTDVGVSELVKKRKGIERREITGVGLPSPRGEIETVGFVVGDAIPALEYLLASSIVLRGFRVGLMDPGPIGVVAGSGVGGPGLEGAVVGVGRRGRGGFSGEREEEEDGSEAEEREKWEERDFLCVLLLSAGHCLTAVVQVHITRIQLQIGGFSFFFF
ncbi:hypothetical protein CFP56_027037, partial [Quercus suber]